MIMTKKQQPTEASQPKPYEKYIGPLSQEKAPIPKPNMHKIGLNKSSK